MQFNNNAENFDSEMKIGMQVIPKNNGFKYLQSMIQDNIIGKSTRTSSTAPRHAGRNVGRHLESYATRRCLLNLKKNPTG